MPRQKRFGPHDVRADAIEFIPEAALHVKWDPDVLARTEPRIAQRYVLSLQAVRLLLGTETLVGPIPMSRQTASTIARRGQLESVVVATYGGRPVRAFSAADIDGYFRRERQTSPPWHRLPRPLREQLGIDF